MMNQIIKDTQAIVATYSTAIEGLGLKIDALTARVKALEDQLNPTE